MLKSYNQIPCSYRVLASTAALICTSSFNFGVLAAPAKKPVKKLAPAAKKAAPARRPGYIIGRVTNTAGKPLAGAEISLYGTTMAGANTSFSLETGADGRFSQRVPEGIYGASAYYKTRYNGKNYRFTLMPKDGTTAKKHDSAPGVIKDFVWKISGLKPGEKAGEEGTHTEGNKYYGGYVYLTSKEEGFGGKVYFPAGSKLTITMTPRGSLIDGSTGKAKTFQRAFAKDITSSLGWHLTDIPVGLYRLQANLILPDGTMKNLGVKNQQKSRYDDPFLPVVNVDFEPTSFDDMQMMQVQVEP